MSFKTYYNGTMTALPTKKISNDFYLYRQAKIQNKQAPT